MLLARDRRGNSVFHTGTRPALWELGSLTRPVGSALLAFVSDTAPMTDIVSVATLVGSITERVI